MIQKSYIHEYTCAYTSELSCTYMFIPLNVYTVPELYIHVYTCVYIYRIVHTCLYHVCTIALSEDSMYMVQTCVYTFTSMSGGQDSRWMALRRRMQRVRVRDPTMTSRRTQPRTGHQQTKFLLYHIISCDII